VARKLGWRSSGGAPIVVESRLWGVMIVGSTSEPLPAATEARLAEFTELVAMAIANSESRNEITRLADEQAALRRVATLVARDAAPAEVFQAVVTEIGQLIPEANAAALSRYETDVTLTLIGKWSRPEGYVAVGERYPLTAGTIGKLISDTHRPGRVNVDAEHRGSLPAVIRDLGWISVVVGAPILVAGRLWGLVGIASPAEESLPLNTEERLTAFTELIATAIANADGRAELAASRARIVATADATQRRIERDLHDGAQQQLVSLALNLRAAQATLPPELTAPRAELSRVVAGLTTVLDELREIARGIHPAILSEGGLGPALKTLARRSPIPVALDVQVAGRPPESVEVAAYYVVSETLTNAAKHAQASTVHASVAEADGSLVVSVRDDGVGGADPARGTGLVGLRDRVEALGGTMTVRSPEDEGTAIEVALPLDSSG
jgi:signal transduction histidine kinase